MNNADWLEEPSADTSGRIFFSEEGVQAKWGEIDPLEAIVLYDPCGEKTYGERWEFGVARKFGPQYSFKIIPNDRFGDWCEDITTAPSGHEIVECILKEYDEHQYTCDFAKDIDWDNVEEFRILLDPEND